MSCSHRYSLDPAWLWLWCRPAAVALIQPLAWELPYAAGGALKSTHIKKKLTVRKLAKNTLGGVDEAHVRWWPPAVSLGFSPIASCLGETSFVSSLLHVL